VRHDEQRPLGIPCLPCPRRPARRRSPFVHPDDIAAVAALTTPAYEGEALALTGPRALSYAEMAAQIGAVSSRPVRFEAISDEAALGSCSLED
jgi:uncharacterized protein YbjT (DUF2867 family)